MSTVIYSAPIFGPVHSRRLGVSLGINLLPADGKFCTFDCIYCECGYNGAHRPKLKVQTREAVREALEAKGYTISSADTDKIPSSYITLTNEDDIKHMSLLLENLEDNDDVIEVYHNWENMPED